MEVLKTKQLVVHDVFFHLFGFLDSGKQELGFSRGPALSGTAKRTYQCLLGAKNFILDKSVLVVARISRPLRFHINHDLLILDPCSPYHKGHSNKRLCTN